MPTDLVPCMLLGFPRSFGPGAGFPDFLKAIIMLYMGTMLFLFGKFFVANYMTKKPKGSKKQ